MCANTADFAPLLLFLGFEPLGRRGSLATWILGFSMSRPLVIGCAQSFRGQARGGARIAVGDLARGSETCASGGGSLLICIGFGRVRVSPISRRCFCSWVLSLWGGDGLGRLGFWIPRYSRPPVMVRCLVSCGQVIRRSQAMVPRF